MPIRHLVFLDIQDNPQAIEMVEQQLRALSQRNEINCKRFHFSECTSNEQKFSHYFFMDFENVAARDAYLQDRAHINAAINVIIPQLKAGIESVIVFDYEKAMLKPETSVSKGPKGYFFTSMPAMQIAGLEENAEKIHSQKSFKNVSIEEKLAKYSYMQRVTLKPNEAPIEGISAETTVWSVSRRCSTGMK